METPQNTAKTPFVGRTPMITPKVDFSQLSNTVKRVAKEHEVAFSINGSPINPTVNPNSKVRKNLLLLKFVNSDISSPSQSRLLMHSNVKIQYSKFSSRSSISIRQILQF